MYLISHAAMFVTILCHSDNGRGLNSGAELPNYGLVNFEGFAGCGHLSVRSVSGRCQRQQRFFSDLCCPYSSPEEQPTL